MSTSWPLADNAARERLERTFSTRSIDFSAPGFCDAPNFLREEQANPRFLESYAQYVEARSYSAPYLADARHKIVTVAEAVRAAVYLSSIELSTASPGVGAWIGAERGASWGRSFRRSDDCSKAWMASRTAFLPAWSGPV